MFTHAEISERRTRAHTILPRDFGARTEDVYSYCVQEGFFCGWGRERRQKWKGYETREENDKYEMDILCDAYEAPAGVDINESGKEHGADAEGKEARDGEKRNILFQSKLGLFQRKKTDITLVKEEVWGHIQEGKESFGEICREFKDVGTPSCFVSLLYLANEKGLELVQAENGDFRVCRGK